MASLKIVGLCVGAAVLYGIAHDLITTRVCLEYFTVFHPPILGGTRSPTLLAIGWGVLATWWVGVFLGLPLAAFARVGPRPQLGAADLVRPIAALMLVVATLALAMGLVGYGAARAGWVVPSARWARRIPEAAHARFLADLWAHTASYGFGALGGVGLWAWAWWERGRRARDRAGATDDHRP